MHQIVLHTGYDTLESTSIEIGAHREQSWYWRIRVTRGKTIKVNSRYCDWVGLERGKQRAPSFIHLIGDNQRSHSVIVDESPQLFLSVGHK